MMEWRQERITNKGPNPNNPKDITFTRIWDKDTRLIAEVHYPDQYSVGDNGIANLISNSPKMFKSLQNVIAHNQALKPEYQISPSLIRELETIIAEVEGN